MKNYKKINFLFNNEAWENKKPYVKSLPAEKQWKNSIFLFNKKNLGNISEFDKLIVRMSNGFYNMFKFNLEKRLRKNNFYLMRRRFKRLSFKRIFVSRPEIRHKIDKVLLTFYTYNRQKTYLLKKIKTLRLRNLQKLRYKKRNFRRIKNTLYRGRRVKSRFTLQRIIIARSKRKNLMRKLLKSCSYKREYLNYRNAFKLLSVNSLNELKITNDNKKILQPLKVLTNISSNISDNNIKNSYLTKIFRKEIFNNYYKLLLYVNKSKFNETYLTRLGNIFSKFYNKKVEFNIVNLKYFYLNSDLLNQALKIKLRIRKNRVVKLLRILINLVSIPKIKSKLSDINAEPDTAKILPLIVKNRPRDIKASYNNGQINKKKEFLSLTAFKAISGVKVKASGRLTRRLTASRAISKSRQKGSLRNLNSSYKGLSSEMLRNQHKNNMDMTQVTSYVRNGSFGLKSWLAHF